MVRYKIKQLSTLKKIVRLLQCRRKTVVFTNGCFDLIHAGHVQLLEQCKRMGDCLILALNSDASVRRIKGPARPIQTQRDRAYVCAAFEPVDYVIMFNEQTPERIIKELKPDILVKGGDWPMHAIVGKDVVRSVIRIPLMRGRSSSAIIRKIQRQRLGK